MGYSLLEYLWLFIIYAFLGWCIEVAYYTVTSGKFVNRGFLNGPICPIYGFGMILLISLLGSLVDNFILLFIGSLILTSTLEFITGFVLEKLFNTKWWDYTDMPFNLKGYISLSFSILWGLASVFVLNIIHPTIVNVISIFNNKIGNIVLVFFLTFFLADFIITVSVIMKINKRMLVLTHIGKKLRLYSDDIGENIYKGMTVAIKTKDSIYDRIGDSKSDFEVALDRKKEDVFKLKVKYDHLLLILLQEKNFVHKRLEKAFPSIKENVSNLKNSK